MAVTESGTLPPFEHGPRDGADDECGDLTLEGIEHTAVMCSSFFAKRLNFLIARIRELEASAATGQVPEGWKLVPLERSYDMRAKATIAFNTATASSADRDDALKAAWDAEYHAAPTPRATSADDARNGLREHLQWAIDTIHENRARIRYEADSPVDRNLKAARAVLRASKEQA